MRFSSRKLVALLRIVAVCTVGVAFAASARWCFKSKNG